MIIIIIMQGLTFGTDWAEGGKLDYNQQIGTTSYLRDMVEVLEV